MKIVINNKTCSAKAGQTILEVARENGLVIPSLCEHPDLDVKANCRVCAVEIKGKDRLVTACSTAVQDGMEISIDSPKAKKARVANIELLFGEHTKKCADCTQRYDCGLLHLARQYKVDVNRFHNRKANRRTYCFANAVEIDGTQCIDCSNCVEACTRQGINYLEMTGSGINQEIKPVMNDKSACIYCGQCSTHCPVAAAQEHNEAKEVDNLLHDKKKRIIVAQFAPSIRVSLGELFGFPYGYNCEGQIDTALSRLGFDYVFDVNFGADITTMTEAEELLERLEDKKAVWPMTTSCCPAWVAYAEFYHPELLPNLTTARSPHIHLGGAIKTYWAQKKKIDPKDIIVVSIMPCTAKKYEASRKELWIKGQPAVDYVLTTRELAYLIKKNKIDFKNLPKTASEPLFNNGSGAAAIYGASGGVMESALRSAVALACERENKSGGKKKKINKLCNNRLEFKDVRGLTGFKEAVVDVAGKKLRVGVVNGIANFPKVFPHLKKYHYIEVMSCPGGCLGGGGQPIPTTNAIRKKRMEGLYNIDKSRSIRRAHENKAMVEFYDYAKKNGLTARVLTTKFKKSRGSILTSSRSKTSAFLGLF